MEAGVAIYGSSTTSLPRERRDARPRDAGGPHASRARLARGGLTGDARSEAEGAHASHNRPPFFPSPLPTIHSDSVPFSLRAQSVVDFLERTVTRFTDADTEKMCAIASKLEQTVWSEARSQREYEDRIQRKLQRVENSKQHGALPDGKENGETRSARVAAPQPSPPALQPSPPTDASPHGDQTTARMAAAPHHRSSYPQQPPAGVTPTAGSSALGARARTPRASSPPSSARDGASSRSQSQQQQQQQPWLQTQTQPPVVPNTPAARASPSAPNAATTPDAHAAPAAPVSATSRRGIAFASSAAVAAAAQPRLPSPLPPNAPLQTSRPRNAAAQYDELVMKLRKEESSKREYMRNFVDAVRKHEENKATAPEMRKRASVLRSQLEEYMALVFARKGEGQRGVVDILRLNELHAVMRSEVVGSRIYQQKTPRAVAGASGVGGAADGAESQRGSPGVRGAPSVGASAYVSSLARAPVRQPPHRPHSDAIHLLKQLAGALERVPAVVLPRQAFAMALARLSGSEGGPVGPETLGWRSRGSEADPPDHHPAATAVPVGAPTAAATAGPAATASRQMGGAKRAAPTREAGAKRPRTSP